MHGHRMVDFEISVENLQEMIGTAAAATVCVDGQPVSGTLRMVSSLEGGIVILRWEPFGEA